jgi:cytochrome c-type protein NapC
MRIKIYNSILQIMERFCRLRIAYRLSVFFGLFVFGVMFWGAFNTGMAMTNKESFCISCHEMNDYVYQEYKHTVHYNNRTGVRATCPDCHVPKEWVHMAARKIGATNELFHKIIGSIDTPEKFHKKRLQLAQFVWDNMRSTDSRECRNCHAFVYMDLAKQKLTSQQAHQRAVDMKRTCIDCHMGIAHQIAKDFDSDGKLHAAFKREKRPCADCHKHLVQGGGW